MTDSAAFTTASEDRFVGGWSGSVVPAEFARTLERRLAAAEAERDKWQRLEREAANYVEIEICMRSPTFTGEPPYVGWEGLGLALRADYDALAAAEARVRELELAATDLIGGGVDIENAETDEQNRLGNERAQRGYAALRAALADPPKGEQSER